MAQARFVVIEGLDGAGTTTQVQRLAEWLGAQSQVVHTTWEPSGGPIGLQIRKTLTRQQNAPTVECLPWLFAADRADHLAREIEPALRRGEWVLSDRYYHSSMAYQSQDLPLDFVHALNARFRAPDLCIYIDVPVDVALHRIAERGGERELFEVRDRMEKICAQYALVNRYLSERDEPIVAVDGTASLHAVTDAITGHVQRLLGV